MLPLPDGAACSGRESAVCLFTDQQMAAFEAC